MDLPPNIFHNRFLPISFPPFLNDGSRRRDYSAGRAAHSAWGGSLPGFLFVLYSRIVLLAGSALQSLRKFLNGREDSASCIRRRILRRHISAGAKSVSTMERFDSCMCRVIYIAALPVHGAPQLGQHTMGVSRRLLLCPNDRIPSSEVGCCNRHIYLAHVSVRTIQGRGFSAWVGDRIVDDFFDSSNAGLHENFVRRSPGRNGLAYDRNPGLVLFKRFPAADAVRLVVAP